jgi:hypothetical protein
MSDGSAIPGSGGAASAGCLFRLLSRSTILSDERFAGLGVRGFADSLSGGPGSGAGGAWVESASSNAGAGAAGAEREDERRVAEDGAGAEGDSAAGSDVTEAVSRGGGVGSEGAAGEGRGVSNWAVGAGEGDSGTEEDGDSRRSMAESETAAGAAGAAAEGTGVGAGSDSGDGAGGEESRASLRGFAGAADGTRKDWPHFPQATLTPAFSSGALRAALHLGQQKRSTRNSLPGVGQGRPVHLDKRIVFHT